MAPHFQPLIRKKLRGWSPSSGAWEQSLILPRVHLENRGTGVEGREREIPEPGATVDTLTDNIAESVSV